MSYIEDAEQMVLNQELPIGQNNEDVFRHQSSAGANNEKLARILIALKFAFSVLKWDDNGLIDMLTGYQASIDARYHNDYKSIATIQELDKRIHTRGQTPPSILTGK